MLPNLAQGARVASTLLVIARWVIALGAVAWSVTGQADSGTLTLYGIVDTGVSAGRVSRSGQAPGGALSAAALGMNTGVLSGGSRWGLTGTESLGGLWSAQFVLEGGVNTDTGEFEQYGRLFGRQATLSLQRKGWFEFDLGLQMNLASRYFLAMDPFHGGTSQLALGTSFGNANVIRYANLLQLQVAAARDLTLGVSYSFNAQLPAAYRDAAGSLASLPVQSSGFAPADTLRVMSAGAQYVHGPLTLAAGYDRAFPPSTVSPSVQSGGPTAWLVGGRYDFKVLALSAVVGQSFNGAFDGQSPGPAWTNSGLATTTPGSAIRFEDGYDANSIFIGVTAPVSVAWTLSVSWQAMQPRGRLAGNAVYATQQVVSLALLHQLSPRVTLYGFVSDASNYAMIRTARSQVAGLGLAYTF